MPLRIQPYAIAFGSTWPRNQERRQASYRMEVASYGPTKTTQVHDLSEAPSPIVMGRLRL